MDGEAVSPPVVLRPMDVDLFRRSLRDKGLTPEACAEKIGVGRNTPRRWLNGDVVPMLDKAQRLVALLDLTVDELWPTPKSVDR